MIYELTDEERSRILPRIEKYLVGRKYFGFIGPTYPVSFENEGPVSREVAENRRRAAEWWQHH
jgi:hypothetical protein